MFIGVGMFRVACNSLIDYIGLSSGAKVDIKVVILFGFVIDLLYEAHASMLLAGGKKLYHSPYKTFT